MGCCETPSIPDPATAAVGGIQADTELQPFNYLINAAAQLGKKINIGGKEYDFTGLGAADTEAKVSDQMAQTLLDLQTELSPDIIAQRLAELKAADPQGYAAREQLFNKILEQAKTHPGRPVNTALQQQLQAELDKGVGMDDRYKREVLDTVRGGQVARGITLGNAPAVEEAQAMVSAGEKLRSQREQNALNLLQSGTSPEDIAYREMQQNLSNLGSFVAGKTPTSEFASVSGAANGPVSLTGGAPSANTFNPNAGNAGMNAALGTYNGQMIYANQANPWLAGLSTGATTLGSVAQTNPQWFKSNPQPQPTGG